MQQQKVCLLCNFSTEVLNLCWMCRVMKMLSFLFNEVSHSELLAVPRVKLGSQGLEVSAQGLGCMGMSAFYGTLKPEADMIALMQHAVDSGITFFDTSDMYGPHTNEILVGKVRSCFLCATTPFDRIP